MSASEKLRAMSTRGDVEIGLALRNALPLIADVVEAAEAASRYVTDARDSLDEDEMEDGEPSVTAVRLMAAEIRLQPALTALQEHLEGGDVT